MPCTNAHVFPIPISEEIAMQMNTRSQCLFLYVVLVFLFSFLIIMLSFAKYLLQVVFDEHTSRSAC